MTQHFPSRRLPGLVAAALVTATLPAPMALAAPMSGPAPQRVLPAAPVAQAPVAPARSRVAIPAASGTVTVNGTARRLVAHLAPRDAKFTLYGLLWTSKPADVTLQARTRTASGWGAWQDLDAEQVETEARLTTGASDPVWSGPSTAVEVRAFTPTGSTSTVRGLQASLINSTSTTADQLARTADTKVSAAANSSTPSKPTIISRASWGADESLLKYNGSDCVRATIDKTILGATVHHTEGTNSYTAAQSASIVRGIYAFHVMDRGWCDVGYNFLVDKYGQVFEGRHGGTDLPVHGAHATLWNTNTVGVSVMMNSSTAQPTPAAMDALSSVIAWKLAGNYRDPLSTVTLAGKTVKRIFRHGDVMSTECPGTNITAYMPKLRQQVATKMGAWQTPIYQAWQARGGESGTLGAPNVLERPWNGGRTTTFAGGGIYQLPNGTLRTMGRPSANRYLATGSFTKLGWPTADEAAGPVANSSRTNFTGGTIWASSAAGAHITTGAVDAYLKAHPEVFTQIGLPKAEAVTTTTGGSQQFERGSLAWTGTTVSVRRTNGKMGDQNADGRADLVTVSPAGKVTWYPTGTTNVAGTGRAGSALGGTVTWAAQTPDMDKDGFTDLLVRRSDGTLWAWRGQGSGKYGDGRLVGRGWGGMRQITVVPSMINGAGVALVAISSDQRLYRYTLGGNLSVSSKVQIGSGWQGLKQIATVGDIRGAGVMDILATDAQGVLWDYAGTRDGRLTGSRTKLATGWTMAELRSIGDVTGDGRMDLVGRLQNGDVYVYPNMLNGRWGARVKMMGNAATIGNLA